MQRLVEFLVRVALLALICFVFWLAADARLSSVMNLSVIVVGVLLTFPLVWLGRRVLDRHQTIGHAVWTTTLVHFALGLTLGVPTVRAVITHRDWSGWVLPVPSGVGYALVIITGAASLLTVVNLGLKGLGAPGIALSRRLAADWFYAWTRNPMLLAGLAFFLSLGIWFQSLLFVLWALGLFAPAALFFIREYEERELEIRFGEAYRLYRASTPFLWPSMRPRTPPNLRMHVDGARTTGGALGRLQRPGDREAMRRLVQELETDELPTQHPGELRRMHFRSAPVEQYSILFAPADHPPPTYPADLPWVPGAKTSVLVLGPGQPVTVHWLGVEVSSVAERIIASSIADGWAEAPGLRFPTATGVRVVFLQRAGAVRHLMVVARPEGGMIQLTQGVDRHAAGPDNPAPRAG
jgi:protein-S-isoprenylcysteine O-methyltransferase Ste14